MTRRPLAAVVLVLAVFLGVGCSEPEKARPAARPTPTMSPSIDPHFQFGQTILITKNGFQPQQLIAVLGQEITFINESNRPRSVEALSGSFRSGPIRPGETFVFEPEDAVSVAYRDGDSRKVTGAIQVEPVREQGNN